MLGLQASGIAPKHILLACAVLTVAWFVWPTPWIVGGSGARICRVNRLTGVPTYASDQGWQTEAEQALGSRLEASRRRAAEERATRQALSEIAAVRVDDQRQDWAKVAVHNRTRWELQGGSNMTDNVVVEYFRVRDGGGEEFLWRDELTAILNRRGYTDIVLVKPYSTHPELERLPSGTTFTQLITMRFECAKRESSSRDGSAFVFLTTPFELKSSRTWVTTGK
jgi:hypothetical protein